MLSYAIGILTGAAGTVLGLLLWAWNRFEATERGVQSAPCKPIYVDHVQTARWVEKELCREQEWN